MPFAEVNLVPSVNIESTLADNPTGISASSFIRWKGALPEKRGGNTLYINQVLEGVPYAVHPWGDIDGSPYVGIGTTSNVYRYDVTPGALFNISPNYSTQASRGGVTPVNLSTIAGSSVVTVIDPTSSNLTTYDSVTFNVAAYVGGVLLEGTYPIISAGGFDTYQIDAGPNYLASSTVNNGGQVPTFTTTQQSDSVTVNFPVEYVYGSLKVGARVGFAIPTSVGGVVIYGQYIVQSVPNPTTFTIIAGAAASSTATVPMNNGNLDLTYWISQGPLQIGSGFGTNEYGQYGFGQGSITPPQSGNIFTSGNWWLDNRGSTLIASAYNVDRDPITGNVVGGPIFYWNSSNGYQNLSIFDGAPLRSNGSFVSMPYGNVMAWGCSTKINLFQDPLFISWSDSGNPNYWLFSANSGGGAQSSDAGFYTVPTGSKVVRGLQAQTLQYWFTDIDVYTAQYVGYPGTYGFTRIGTNCGLVAPKGAATLQGSVYWMSNRQFFVSQGGGAPQPIPCSVWDFIFQNMDTRYIENVVCGTNALFNEVTWFFPTLNQVDGPPPFEGIPNAYVCYNTQYNEWDVGYINRTAWTDQSLVGEPLSCDSGGYVYQQDTSYNNAIGPLTFPMNSWLKTGYFSIGPGEELNFIDWLLPDFKWGQYNQLPTAELQITFYVTDYAGQDPRVYGPYVFNKETKFICPRFRGRFVSMKIESNDVSSFWRLGSIRYRFAPSGRR